MEFIDKDELALILDALVHGGAVHPEKAEFAREKYCEIHDEFQRSVAALDKLTETESRLLNQINESDLAGNEMIQCLNKDLHEAQEKALLAVQKGERLNEEIQELEEMKTEIGIQVEQDTESHRKELQLIMEKVTKETEDLQDSLRLATTAADKAKQEICEHESGIANCTQQILSQRNEKDTTQRAFLKIKSEPGKLKNQTDVMQTLLTNTKAQNSELETRLQEMETSLSALQTRQKEAELELTQAQSSCEQGRVAITAKQTDIEDIQGDIDLTLAEYQQHLADRVQIDLFTQEKAAELSKMVECKRQVNKEKEDYTRLVKDSEEQLKKSKDELPYLETTKQKLVKEKQELENQIKTAKEETCVLKKDEDVLISEILKDEKHGAGVREIVSQVSEQNRNLESEIESHKNIEKANIHMHTSLISKRDRLQRTLSLIMERQKKVEAELALKDKNLGSLESLLVEKQKHLAESQELHDLMKKQKNQFLHMIKVSQQGEQELDNKMKLLESEANCQRSQLEEKRTKFEELHSHHEVTKSERDSARNEISKLSLELSKQLSNIDEESSKLEKTMAVIQQLEQEMTKEKHKFENLLHNRNYTGLLLIDRNDELCLLYEKSNLQEHIIRQSELELKQRDDDFRRLKIQTQELERSNTTSRKLMEQIPRLDKEIAWLQCQLLEAQRQTKEISQKLEDPQNDKRWRRLFGTDPEAEQLDARIQQLEDAIDCKEEQVLERTMVLQEITQMTKQLECLRDQPERMQRGEDLVRQQRRIQTTRQKFKATKAEVSIYKELASDYEMEFKSLQDLLLDANRRLDEGLAPTEEFEKQWMQLARHEEIIQNLAQEKEAISQLMASEHNHRSTCVSRPNAYIPEELGIPRPFGSGVFKPTPAGANMRFYKKPTIPDVII